MFQEQDEEGDDDDEEGDTDPKVSLHRNLEALTFSFEWQTSAKNDDVQSAVLCFTHLEQVLSFMSFTI